MRDAEAHLRVGEGGSRGRLALQQAQLPVKVKSERVDNASARNRPSLQPVPRCGKQLRARQVANAAYAVDVVPVKANDAIAAERRSTDNLTLQRQSIAISRRDMDNGPNPLLSCEGNCRQR
jgi:hypothetical protein